MEFHPIHTCATLDELRLNVSFSRLNAACSFAMNRCSCRNECAKSMISNKLPLLIDCIFMYVRLTLITSNQLQIK